MDSPSWLALLCCMTAFILYTASSLSVRRSRTLHALQAASFWAAFALILASTLAGPIAEGTLDSPLRISIAILLVLLPAISAFWTQAAWMHHSDIERLKTFCMLLWGIWLIPFSTGLCLGFLGSCLSDIPALALCTTVILALSLCLRNAGSRQDA
jgi:hypothetical protein